ncbi:MAG: GTP-binding protein [Candidatus Ranarchaeia archaeon]
MSNIDSYDYLFKVIVIGDGQVGKTSLTFRFSTGSFRQHYLMTIGVEFAVKMIQIDNKQVKLQIWDTGGQERFSYIRPLYYRGAVGAIVAFDLTNDDTFLHIPNWIAEVRKYCGVVPMILVGTKSDLEDQRQVTKERAEKYAAELNATYFETSSKTGLNVIDVFENLGRRIISANE